MNARSATWRNWGRTVLARPAQLLSPRSIEDVRMAVLAAGQSGAPLKAVGAGHSFSPLAHAPHTLMSLDALRGLRRVDPHARTATFGAGTRLRDIPALLRPHGLAMENLGDIDAQSLAGAVSTGTHGTGIRFGGLATQVTGVTLVTGRGELRTIDADDNPGLLPAVALGLGVLGVLVEVTIRCVESFDLTSVERAEPLDTVLATLDERVASTDHFEFFWFPHTTTALTKTNTRAPAGRGRSPLSPPRRWFEDTFLANGVFRATCAFGRAVPAAVPTINRTAVRLTGQRRYADASDRVFATRRSVRFTEMEYALPADQAVSVFREVQQLIERRRWRISFPVEVRFAGADETWLSTAYRRTSAYLAVHRAAGEDPAAYFSAVEEIARERGGRPHWGKIHRCHADDLAALYPRFDDFRALRAEWDPVGVFLNAHVRRILAP